MKSRRHLSEEQRGYGVPHRRLKERLRPFVQAGKLRCVYCGEVVVGPFHLDHTDDRRGWSGVAHPACNMREGGLKSARLWRGKTTVTSREW